jgi:hypothetical protein
MFNINASYAILEEKLAELERKPKSRLSQFDSDLMDTIIFELNRRDNNASIVARKFAAS